MAWILPCFVRGPVECSQGLFARVACLNLSRASGVRGLRFRLLRLPAATLLGLGRRDVGVLMVVARIILVGEGIIIEFGAQGILGVLGFTGTHVIDQLLAAVGRLHPDL